MKRRRHRINPDTLMFMKQIAIGIGVLSLAVAIVTGIWHGTRLPAMTIDSVEVTGGETVNLDHLHSLVLQNLEGAYLGLIPKKFVWFYPRSSIINSLSAVDRVHDVTVIRKAKSVRVSFEEYVPDSLWCDDQNEGCLFVDEFGYAFSKAPDLTGGSFLRIVTSGKEISVETEVLSIEEYDYVKKLTNLLQENNWYVSTIEVDQAGDAYLKLVGGGELKVKLSDSPEQIVNNFLVITASEEFSHIKPGNFQYIDLRFGDKVYVNEELAVPKEETASDVSTTTTGI